MRDSMSVREARRMALGAQGFARARPGTATPRHLRASMHRLGVTQIDSVRVFERAHYLPFFSRLGGFATSTFDALTMTPSRRRGFVEYLPHEAGFIAVEDWPLWGFRMRRFRER